MRYGVAVVAVALALGLKLLLDPLIEQETPFLLVFAAIMVGAWLGGLGPGLLATAIAAVVTDYFFLPPVNSFSDLSLESLPLAVFVLEGVLVSSVVAALRHAREHAEASTREARSHQESLRRSEELYRSVLELLEEPEAFRVEDLLDGVDVLLIGRGLGDDRREVFLRAVASTLETAATPVLALSPGPKGSLAAEDRLVPWPCRIEDLAQEIDAALRAAAR